MTMTADPPATETPPEAATTKGGKKKLLIIIVAVLALGGGGYWFVLKPGGGAAEPEPGEVVPLETLQVNLAGGHYLRLGLALQLTSSAHEADGSKALDAAIELFSGRSIADVTRPVDRRKLKKELEHTLHELYHEEVMGVYFTEFVTQ
ncbi:MAG: flagellar basal body-associated FliL family protein [Nocardioides sp.]